MDPFTRAGFDSEMERLRAADAEAGRVRSWAALASELLHAGRGEAGDAAEPCPESPMDLLYIQAMHGRLGTDANGRALLSEMCQWWNEEGIADPGVRQAYEVLWRALESETSRFFWEERERAKTERSLT